MDYYGAKKRAFAYLRRCQRPLHLILREPNARRRGYNHYLAGHPPFAFSDYRRWLAELTRRNDTH